MSDLKAKMHQNRFRRAPRSPSWADLRDSTSKGRGGVQGRGEARVMGGWVKGRREGKPGRERGEGRKKRESREKRREKGRGQWLKCNGTQGNAVPPPAIYGSERSSTSDCYNARERHTTIVRGPNLNVAFPHL